MLLCPICHKQFESTNHYEQDVLCRYNESREETKDSNVSFKDILEEEIEKVSRN